MDILCSLLLNTLLHYSNRYVQQLDLIGIEKLIQVETMTVTLFDKWKCLA